MSLLLEALRKAEKHSAATPVPAPVALELEAVPETAPPALRDPAPARSGGDEARPRSSQPRGIAEVAQTRVKPRSPFQVVVGLLAAIAVAAMGYYWHQIQPAPQLVNSAVLPQRPDAERAAAQSSAKLEIPGLPIAAPAPTSAPVPVIAREATPIATRSTTRAAPKPAAAAAAPDATPVAPRREVARIHPQVATGYAALREGDLDAARAAYRTALQEEPDNADAMLGMAALEISLGNQMARQGRWTEAQLAYSRALTNDPDNADVAFNLAVSLDRLHQPVQAITYYERALALAARRVVSFSPVAARLRLQQLAP